MAHAEKGVRYMSRLDNSLCNGAWPDISENARKVEKHLSERACLTLAARCEAQIASASHRPTSASSSATSSIHSLGDLIPKLQQAIEAETRHVEDAYVASVCLAEIFWLRGEEEEALRALQKGNVSESGTGHVSALGWQEVCAIKASFIRGAVLEGREGGAGARRHYLAAAARAPGSRTAELRRWTERLLARACMFMWKRADSHSLASLSDALRCFQAWSDFWQRSPSPGPPSSSHLDIGRRDVWRAYYHLLSIILQQGLLFTSSPASTSDLLTAPSDGLSDDQLSSFRLRQRATLKKVESTYESLLLNETQFPKASQTNLEVEEWIERVAVNWKIFCGSSWSDDELGEGGQEVVSRGVLDMLYRASSKTFHSTAILRQLFTVHASLGEFDLAMHAFDSYVEIVSKGKTRAEKTGKHETGFDSDDVAVQTAAKAINILCRYGDYEQAEKANEITRILRRWLGQRRPGSSGTVDTVNGDNRSHSIETDLQSQTLAVAYRAMGISKAHWARVTFDNDARDKIRTEAIKYLRQAQAQDQQNLDTAYALGMALAESRNPVAAAQAVRDAIATSEADEDDDEDTTGGESSRERQLMPLWHLLALCRTATDDFESAAKMCETAFEQFGDSTVLFGDRGIRTSIDSEKVSRSSRGVVDTMDVSEKACLLQIKMTQLSLLEVMEGADTAVKSSEELLALYARLFGSPAQPKPAPKPTPTAVSAAPPSRSGGTLRSLAGSIRPRSRSARRSVERQTFQPPSSIAEERPGTARSANGQDQVNGAPISITVTNEDGVSAEKQQRHLPFKLRGHQHHHDARSLRGARSQERLYEKTLPSTPEKTEKADRSSPIRAAVTAQDDPTSPQQPLGEMVHNASHNTWPPPPGHKDQPPRQDVRLPVPHPTANSRPQTHITGLQERQHKVSLLVEIWLFIAGLYLRSEQFDDCGGAVEAAFRLVEQFEEEVAGEHSSARQFFEKGWGLGKSIDELWGDVWGARGILSASLESPWEAMSRFERSLEYWPDHADGIIGLSNLLMDVFEENLPVEEPEPDILTSLASASSSSPNTSIPPPSPRTNGDGTQDNPQVAPTDRSSSNPSPAQINRLAARDRAYMLLSTLTKLPAGTQNSEAWLALARSHEISKQTGRAKKALWWVVKLEEGRPLRKWECAA